VKSEIQKIFKGEVMDDGDTLTKYSRDASLLLVRPQVVVYPKDKEDVKNLVRWVNENKSKYPDLSITARCAGTCMSGGAIGESIIMDFSKYMNRLVGGPLPLHDLEGKNTSYGAGKTGWEITVEPGMFYRDFEKLTLAKGLILPCFTASKSLNAMGGMYGNNSAGERTLKYGKTEDYVLRAKVVFSDGNEYVVKPLSKAELDKKIEQNNGEGELYRSIYNLIRENKIELTQAKPKVHKNSAGYYLWNVAKDDNFSSPDFFDLNKLLVGSQGTLGIVTEITFKIIPEQKYSKLVAIFMNDMEPLGRLVDEILTQNPETLESYDDKTMKLAVRFFFDFLKNKGLIGMIKFMFSFLPEAFLMLTGGFPKLIVLAEFAGFGEEEVNKKCLALVNKIKPFNLKTHITKNQTESNKYWDIRRESFALLRKHVKGKHTAPFIDDIIVRPEFLPKFLPELNKILSNYDITFTLAGHAGEGNFHIIPLMDFKRADTAKIVMELGEKVYDLVAKYHGSITAEHNDGLIRTPYLYKMYEPHILSIFSQIKKIFDPKNILNPGKKVPTNDGVGTKDYLAKHVAREHTAVHRV
jgi:FAD/FMN-containing dehydrogenase